MEMGESSRYGLGGFSPRFIVSRTDGKPCRETARYMVLDGSGADPHAVKAIRVYAESVRDENPDLANDLIRMVEGEWSSEFAQHTNAR